MDLSTISPCSVCTGSDISRIATYLSASLRGKIQLNFSPDIRICTSLLLATTTTLLRRSHILTARGFGGNSSKCFQQDKQNLLAGPLVEPTHIVRCLNKRYTLRYFRFTPENQKRLLPSRFHHNGVRNFISAKATSFGPDVKAVAGPRIVY